MTEATTPMRAQRLANVGFLDGIYTPQRSGQEANPAGRPPVVARRSYYLPSPQPRLGADGGGVARPCDN